MENRELDGLIPQTTLDLSTCACYGWYYQPVIGSNKPMSLLASLQFAFLHLRFKQIRLLSQKRR